LDNVVIDSQLAKVAGAAISLDGSYAVHIDVSLRNLADRIVDEDGYVEIATVYYQTHIYEISPFETATFTPAVISMTDKAGAALPTAGIRAEHSVVLLYDPQVPMILVSPTYLETLQGDVLAMKIRVYNLPDISSIDINLVDFRQVGNTYIGPTSVVINPQIAKVAGGSITTEADYSTTVRFTLRNPTSDDLVDENGYAELATFYYQTGIYEVSPTETATFSPTVLLMADKLGNDLPTDQIRAEGSVVLLHEYWSRYVAYWEMGYGEGLADIYDQSQNNLDGTATGTTVVYGARGSGYARSFNGSSDYIEVPDNALLDIQNEIAISMWVYVAVGAAPNPLSSLICKRTEDGPINYQLLLEDVSSTDGYRSLLFKYGSAVHHTYRVDVPDNRSTGWFHVLFSYRFGEPSSAMMAVGYGCWTGDLRIPGAWITGDGRETAPNTSGALFMGKDNASTANYFAGSLDEVELFDIVWTPGLIQYYLFTGCR
jgi:hypothetical protein